MTGKLAAKAALVTGGSRGIGRGIAMALADEGAAVAIVSRSQSGTDAVAAEITERGGRAVGIACDISDGDAISAAVARTVEEFGRLDILVNNAQGFGSAESPASATVLRPVEELPEAEWDYNLLTGPTATLRFMQAAFPHLESGGAGRVINFGSMWGQMGFEGAAAYNASKEAIRALSRTAAREWGKHGITVNIINPIIHTDAYEGWLQADPAAATAMLDQIPLRRQGTPEEAGRIAAFIAGPDAAYLTGMTFQVDGGTYMHAG